MKDQETLDPKDWDALSELAHKMVDESLEYLRTLRERPVWQPMPESTRSHFQASMPEEPQELSEVYDEVKAQILPYNLGNIHPRFWGWYMGNGTVGGALAEFLTGVMNPNTGKENQAGTILETQVIRWLSKLMGYPEDSSGILVSGGSMANFIGVAVARQEMADFDIRRDGILAGGKQFTIYASTQVHSCSQKNIELMGIGAKYFRKIRTNSDFTIDVEDLKVQISKDRRAGLLPICIIGSAGTVNTGAIDDLNALAEIANKENIWFHVDGAIGAIAMISDEVRPLLDGIDKSDSIALDLHKWLHIPFEAGCCLVKSGRAHYDTFNLTPDYLTAQTRGISAGEPSYKDFGIQLSRRMRALKIWMQIKEHGRKRLAQMIEKNIDQARYLSALVDQEHELELLALGKLDIVCFRFAPDSFDEKKTNDLNKELVLELQVQGLAVVSTTTLGEKLCIRVAISNHRSQLSDFDFLVKQVLAIGRELQLLL
jgi:glutamate/tyrosine decarboxylase-like PLP-dependent enzyme